ncbi:MAG: hypothetical protein GY854_23935 [Deltaproteobacteria bacterium]|nr:hypothetical protein [Deltaproteobacteria bacterium]
MRVLQYVVISVLVSIVIACESSSFDDGSGFDGGTDTDTDIDADADADMDSDTDTDADGDPGADGDSDTDTDADSGGDADSDTDTDTDTDTDGASGDADGDSDNDDTDVCVDSDSDGWCEEFECDDENQNVNPDQSEIEGNNIDDDCDSITDEEEPYGPGGDGTIQGIVKSASGFPISGALVYLTEGDGPQIPDQVFCYECDDVTKGLWTLSNSDGTWTIDNLPPGTIDIVTRKGFFQREREITIDGTPGIQTIPEEITTLPGENSDNGLDQIPDYAVLLNGYDLPEDMLAKMGMGTLNTQGHLQHGTQHFDMYNDGSSSSSAVGSSSVLFESQENLNEYHMIFFPCIASALSADDYIPMLQSYVESGGKIYSSCWASQWVEQPFPQVIEYHGDNTLSNAGNIGEYDTYGAIQNQDMIDWLAVVAPAQDHLQFPFFGAFIQIDSLSYNSYDGHGVVVQPDGTTVFGQGPVTPEIWVVDANNVPPGGTGGFGGQDGTPMTVTYNYDCGEIFYSSYQVVESSPSPSIRPQEWVLIYLFYEIGVCEGDYNEVVN